MKRMIKCKDCKHAKKGSYSDLIMRCSFPLPDWLMSGPSGGSYVNKDAERECALFVSKKSDGV